jgi:hypothetical protein
MSDRRRTGLRGPASMLALLVLGAPGCRRAAGGTDAPGGVRFVDVAPTAGIRFTHMNGRSGRYFIAETMGSGCAFLDYDGDGRLDLFLVNSSRLPGFGGKSPFYPALYRNEGNGQFRDVTQQAGLALDCYGMGVAVGDYDNDGDPDLLLTSYGGSHLFRNDHGHFHEVTDAAGVKKPAWGAGAAWFDYDRDGYLDLFICSYVDWTTSHTDNCGEGSDRYICGPTHYGGAASVLYHNDRNGRFTDVTKRAGIANPNGKALGVAVWDVDQDGWPDLAVSNDSEPNWLFHNNRNGTFSESGVEAGIAYANQGKARAGMGADTADYDHSGREALLIGNNTVEGLAFFRPLDAAGHFTDAADEVGLFEASLPFSTFGARFVDVDLDGFPDILTANGHVNEHIARTSGSFTFAERMQLFHNEADETGKRRFRDVTAAAGPGLNSPRVARGLAVGDFDGDGDPDFLVTANNGAAALVQNQGPPKAHWLAFRLIGDKSNREGIGARIRVTAGGQTQSGWVRSGGSYCSEDEHVARFGLAGSSQADRVEVHWPSGLTDRLENVPANRMITLREGHPQR